MTAFYAAGAPQLPSMFAPKSYAAHPVWKDSTRTDVKFSPLSKREAVRIYHAARDFERKTRAGGGHGFARCVNGKISRVGLAVLHAMLFDFLNFKSGRLDPCYASIADRAGVSISSVYRSLQRLKDCGIVHWVRRCSEDMVKDRYVLQQESNAYGVLPPSQWKGYHGRPDTPPPDPAAWGAAPALPAFAVMAGDGTARIQASLEGNAEPLAGALARLGRVRRPSF